MEKQTKQNGKNGNANTYNEEYPPIGGEEPMEVPTKKKAKTEEKQQSIYIVAPVFGEMTLQVEGTAPIVLHAFGKKSREQMRLIQMQLNQGKGKRDAKNPVADFLESLHVINDEVKLVDKRKNGPDGKPITNFPVLWPVFAEGRFGFPARGFKKALVAACRYVDGITMTEANGLIRVDGCADDPELVELFGPDGKAPKLQMREDIVRLNNGPRPVADIRHRGFIEHWTANLRIRYNVKLINPEAIANLYMTAGFHVGVGEDRPGRSGGQWGTFQVSEGKVTNA